MGVRAQGYPAVVSIGIIAAVVLGLGRAPGETMAVAMVSGARAGCDAREHLFGHDHYRRNRCFAARFSIVADATNFAVKSLPEASLVLMVITLLTNMLARALWCAGRRVPPFPVGRGI